MLPQRERLRMLGWDYSHPGFYFVTLCCHDREAIFGDVYLDRVELSPLGKFVEATWNRIPDHYPGVELGEWVLMPNHLHGLILLPTDLPEKRRSTHVSLSRIVGAFKEVVSKDCGESNLWQRSFHDRVVRNAQELENIRNYIAMNPINWSGDRYNPVAVTIDDVFPLTE